MDPLAHKMPAISPYASFFNNPVVMNDPDGEFGIIGFFVGFAVDVGVQMLANSLAGKPIGDIDWGDALISGAVGMVTGGMGNIAKLSKTTQKLLTAAGIEGKVAKASMKVSAVITEEGIKASIDIKVSNEEGEGLEMKTIFNEGKYAKDGAEAATDFVVGTSLEIVKGGVKSLFKNIATGTLKKEEKELLRKIKRTALGSKNNVEYKAKYEEVKGNIDYQETMSDKSTEVIVGSTEEEVKKKVD